MLAKAKYLVILKSKDLLMIQKKKKSFLIVACLWATSSQGLRE